ncbi:SDR family NAD(P)-dependent oxidoreductase [Streptomyces sp. NPDC051105]|uniref:SDR family NAD(P)-dependent oxidoreductase n=1 Tax=Streptomyces sp. NPDC051105 TaxID=3154843 RepID=UPI00343DFF57
MQIQGATALVTGANRGLGQMMARLLLQRGAHRVYGGARDPRSVREPGVIPVRLDITDPAQVAAAAETCSDATLLVNNAGVLTDSPLLAAPDLDAARADPPPLCRWSPDDRGAETAERHARHPGMRRC